MKIKRLIRNSCLLFLLLINITGPVFGQSSISGVINLHTPVFSVDFCNNLAVVSNPAGFNIGDRILLIQMKGADINLDNAASFGSILNYRDCGNYELLTISDINVNVVTFQEAMMRDYTMNSGIQMVSVPQYIDVSIDGVLTADAWDGFSGGILAFEASGTVTFNDDIDVTGKGFQNGDYYNHNDCYDVGAGFVGYVCTVGEDCGVSKGEGIADVTGFELGRGPAANGGGGGNDHNTGGGGGGNYGAGGDGGQLLETVSGDCVGPFPGLGGNSLDYSSASNKIFLGGGGGNGDQNDDSGTVGAPGGGMVIIIADQIEGNGFNILSDGATVADTAHVDGAGGGGAAGTVLLNVNSVNTALNVELNGGNGGHVDNGEIDTVCHGPGGGGAGGTLWINGAGMPANIELTATGGNAGMTVNATAPAVCIGSTNGATNGENGNFLDGLDIPASSELYVELSLEVSSDTIVCADGTVVLTASGTGTGATTISWSDGFIGPVNEVSPDEDKVYIVVLSDARGCSIADQVFVEVVDPNIAASVTPDDFIDQGESVVLSAFDTTGFVSFLWEPALGLNDPTSSMTLAIPEETTEYCVTATDTVGCTATDCVTVLVIIPEPILTIPNAFTPNSDGINDFHRVINLEDCNLSAMTIYNRWGELIFQGFDNTGWDGTNQETGNDMPVGTYIYFMQIECDEEFKNYSGNVTLLR